jgi:carbon-monoxide dehydrogenase large subunit
VSTSGQSIKRFEDPRLVTGMGSFVDDIKLPDMLHATLVRSVHAHALILEVDASEARRHPGVVTVLTADDIKGVLGDLPIRQLWGDLFNEMHPAEQPILAADRVCYVGQPVAIVVAESLEQARDATELVTVEYDPLPPLLDPYEALEEGAGRIHRKLGNNLGLRILREGGDLDSAFAEADRVIEQRYDVQRLAPAPLENRGLVAHYQPQEDMLTVWDSTQEPHQVWRQLSQLLDRPQGAIRVIAPDVGGGFGAKGCVYPEEVAVPYLALSLRRPVKWVEDRQENMLSFHARGHTVDVAAAVKSDGTILGMRVQIVADLGAYFLSATAAVPLLAGQRIAGPYKTPNMRVEVLGVFTNKPPTGPYRGAGGPESAFCLERTVDLIARELDLDPVELRSKNFISPDSFPYHTPTGLTYDSGEYQRGLDRVLELSDYATWRQRAQESRSQGTLVGVGLATVVKASGGGGEMMTEHARVDISPSGGVTVYTGVSPHGQGTETSYAQVVANELGVSPSNVQVLHSDTSVIPEGGGTAASRGTVAGASALYVVLQDAKRKLSEIASHLLDCPQEAVAFANGRIFNQQRPEQTVGFAEVASAAFNEELLPSGVNAGLEFTGTYTLPNNPYSYAAHVATVEVDRDTGGIKILSYAAVHDCGRVLNPMLLSGQIHGAIAQGVGQALTEGVVYTPDGQPVTGSLMDYALPLAEDFPGMELDTIETPSPTNPLGAKGVGELPTVAAPVAIANAVMDALSGTGVRHIDTPLTPEKVWRALQGQG